MKPCFWSKVFDLAAFRPRLCWRSVAGPQHTAYGIRHTVAAIPRFVSAVKTR
ncbi:MAG: hypothetical protein ACR2L2_07485 [Acidobacteriota bacterium]